MPPSPFVACGLSSPPRPPGSVSAGGGEVRRGEAAYGGWGSHALALEGLGWQKKGSMNASGIPGQSAFLAKSFQPTRAFTSAPHPAFPTRPSRWLQPLGPRGPGKGWEKPGKLGFLGPCGLWTGCPISPSPWSSHRPKPLASCKLSSKKNRKRT